MTYRLFLHFVNKSFFCCGDNTSPSTYAGMDVFVVCCGGGGDVAVFRDGAAFEGCDDNRVLGLVGRVPFVVLSG